MCGKHFFFHLASLFLGLELNIKLPSLHNEIITDLEREESASKC